MKVRASKVPEIPERIADGIPYLTAGKLYEAISVDEETFQIIGDGGQEVLCRFSGCAHLNGGDWEIFYGEQSPQTDAPADKTVLPPRLTDPDMWDKASGKSVDVLISVEGWRGIHTGCYAHELNVWYGHGSINGECRVIEWWPMPVAGTGNKVVY